MITDWLKENIVSRAALAERLGVSRGYMSDLANGNKKPSLEIAMRIHLATGGEVTLESWFSEDEISALSMSVASESPVRADALTTEPQTERGAA